MKLTVKTAVLRATEMMCNGNVRLARAALAFVCLAAWMTSPAAAQTPAAKPEPGLVVVYSVGEKSDAAVAPNVLLYVPDNQPVTPFLSPGQFTATWTGNIAVDLRGNFLFRADLNGALKLEINGVLILDASGDGTKPTEPTKTVRLNKGANAIKATFTSPAGGDAMLRLQWSEKGFLWEPIPLGMLAHAPGDAALAAAEKLRKGRELFFESRCAKCHATAPGAPELTMDAPGFDGIGSRRRFAWMAEWILDPKKQRATAHMPRVFSGPDAQKNAEAAAAFLASLSGPRDDLAAQADESREAGQKLVESLHCTGCHALPGAKDEPGKISLTHINFKFPGGELAVFLKNPGAHYAWTHMPKFSLSDAEAQNLAAHLTSLAPMAKQAAAPSDAATIALGKQLVQSSGCLNCHSLKLDNLFKAKPLADLAVAKLNAGCLAAEAKADSKSPQFSFAADEREVLQAFLGTDRSSLARHVPVEFAERQTRLLNCNACHGQLEGFPTIDKVGGKLKPEWMTKLFAGELKYKPRPWVEHRMPSFPQRAASFAQGLAMSHGYPPKTPAEPPINMEAVPFGQKLAGTDGGFSCVSCHAVGEQKATQVFESEGVNFARPAERLQRAYYERWVRNPLRVEPTTKMPVYFDEEGKSPLGDILGGDTSKQLDALWQWMRMGGKIPQPMLQQ
ncbi:MAG: c-type cytochrome [Verrucomicrobia bacterium]|nr:c-type cytochrome [Verrucomicrobiota bacterium]